MMTDEEMDFFNRCVKCKTQLKRRSTGLVGTVDISIELYCPNCTNIQIIMTVRLINKELLLRFFTDDKFRKLIISQAITKFLTE
jgi:hypothetical protein